MKLTLSLIERFHSLGNNYSERRSYQQTGAEDSHQTQSRLQSRYLDGYDTLFYFYFTLSAFGSSSYAAESK